MLQQWATEAQSGDEDDTGITLGDAVVEYVPELCDPRDYKAGYPSLSGLFPGLLVLPLTCR